MGESAQHTALVTRIVTWIIDEHGNNGGLSILVDAGDVPPGRRPSRIGGYTPDVLARTVPSSFVILGEAKSFSNFFEPHTGKQLSAFLEYLRMQERPMLIVATPLAAAGAARSLVRRVQRSTCATHVPVVFLYG